MEEAIEVLVEEELGMNPTFGEGVWLFVALGYAGPANWLLKVVIYS